MSAVERGEFLHAGRVLSRMENGNNTPAVRHEAIRIIQREILPEESQILNRLLNDLTVTWRHLGPQTGPIEDSQLDAYYQPSSVIAVKGK
ncbi:hypothetical protein A3B51_01550 [Candidatus Curtissbacteria bacterium RIFCSPLOWO2_01_FULL_41_18]|uniref:Uncharacterized protein n=2 Tax=Candidatus Curtissiibacteriota TaxID=1752717 RepID=A0A1F5G0L3_9BACT|nr:MAG: hypothetical protein A2696_03105 [Candidatus Curtissbacteria bacterium RIFCSPHIGHO2_01_FULL_41_13]OGE03839.1 MAG: hypothetical protein A3B51_01550 [Candidatus Curtissbacteria bacterium RIFCSPLOWO2_01_FULL_41_18]